MSKSFEEELIEREQRAIAPNVFIGLGGQGCKMVASLAKKAEEENSPAKYLSFIAIDTDVNELRKIKAISNKVVTVQTSSRMTIGQYLEYDENAKNNWFPINKIILDKTPSEGAGQIRAISNLVAHNAIREGEFAQVNDAIDELFPLSTDTFEQSVHVTIMGTLAGGTGSGLILPVSLYVKNYLEKIRQQKSAVIRGFFILPDVMDSVIKADIEKDNQRSNAYASIREIDAFMRLPYDDNLKARYPELKVIVPKVGGNGYEEFNHAPFNFCFLFNKLNTQSTSITEKDDLLDHAVNCIFDMSISPICTKVNSQEDNIIREKISSGNKTSYVGAGSSKIIYPYESVVDYIALNWANKSISKQWLEADSEIVLQQKKNNETLNKGGFVEEFDVDDAYRNFVIAKAETDPFYKAIVQQTLQQRPGTLEFDEKCDLFTDDLKEFTKELRLKNSSPTADKYNAEALKKKKLAAETIEIAGEEIAEKKKTKATAIKSAVDQALMGADSTIRNANIQIDQIASSIIDADYEKNKENDIPVLEKYMMVHGERFMHPNAARFFLLKLSAQLQTTIEDFTPLRDEVKKKLDSKLDELAILRESKDDYDESKFQKFLNEHKKKLDFEPSARVVQIADIIDEILVLAPGSKNKKGLLEDYCYYHVNIKVFEKIKTYIDGIIEGYKEFYNKISGDLMAIPTKISAIEKEFTNYPGAPRIYVGATPKCLKKTLSTCQNQVGIYDLPTDLTKGIFDKAKKYSTMQQDGSLSELFGIETVSNEASDAEKKESLKAKLAGINAFFGDVFETIIMEFWRTSVVKLYSEKIDIDVVSAIFKEAFVEENCITEEQKRAYLKQVIKSAKNLAVPFIDPPRGVQKREIRASAMHPCIMENLNEENEKYFRTSCLDEFGPELSPDMDKYKILFYHSLYNIAAKNLVKMLPGPRVDEASSVERFKGAGLYFSTYHTRVSKIEPLDSQNTEITPHIQKTWHYLNVLPEVDEAFQKREEIRIAKAFVYGLITGKFAYRKHDKNGYNYCYEIVDSQIMSPQLIVSNGTNCDQFHEVLDALTICPRYVDRLLEIFDENIAYEKALGNDFLSSEFAKDYSTEFAIDEFSTEKFMNIFCIPLLYKASAGSNYIFAWGEAIIAAIFEIIDRMIDELEDSKVADDEKSEFLIKIFEAFTQSLDKLQSLADGDKIDDTKPNGSKVLRKHSRLRRIKTDSITLRIYDMVADLLEAEDEKNAYGDQFTKKIEEIREARRILSL